MPGAFKKLNKPLTPAAQLQLHQYEATSKDQLLALKTSDLKLSSMHVQPVASFALEGETPSFSKTEECSVKSVR